jgi:type II secretory pathway pseudopilin PulG
MRLPPPASTRARGGFSLLEMLIVLLVIMILAGLLFPVVGMIRNAARKAAARTLVRDLHMALRTYADEDPQRRFPPADADSFMRFDVRPTGTLVLNQLMGVGLKDGIQTLKPDPANDHYKVLVDPWMRPYRYSVDAIADGNLQRPAPKTDWNAREVEPFAYVWSLGTPFHGAWSLWTADPDADPANSKNWIYVQNTPTSSP